MGEEFADKEIYTLSDVMRVLIILLLLAGAGILFRCYQLRPEPWKQLARDMRDDTALIFAPEASAPRSQQSPLIFASDSSSPAPSDDNSAQAGSGPSPTTDSAPAPDQFKQAQDADLLAKLNRLRQAVAQTGGIISHDAAQGYSVTSLQEQEADEERQIRELEQHLRADGVDPDAPPKDVDPLQEPGL